jgi:hypothetical protein
MTERPRFFAARPRSSAPVPRDDRSAQSEPVVDVRFGSLADVQAVANYVRLAVKFGRCPSAGHKWVTLNRAIG